MADGSLDNELSQRTFLLGLKLWVVIGIGVGAFIVLILFFLSLWISSRSKSRTPAEKALPITIPMVSKEITVDRVGGVSPVHKQGEQDYGAMATNSGKEMGRSGYASFDADSYGEKKVQEKLWKMVADETASSTEDRTMSDGEKRDHHQFTDKGSNASGESQASASTLRSSCAHTPHSQSSIPQVSHLGWGQWYSLADLESATDFFSDANVLGEGGYGIVYRGRNPDGSLIAVKNLLNNRGQAEREFRVEVEAIGKVRHKNLVRLIGYCAEGSHRMLVYEFVGNGNLDQWLHGKLGESAIPWDARMRIALGTAKGLAYLHEGLEPKVVHRDVKSSNILLDSEWNPKVSDFGLAKLLGAGKSFVTTRVMGTFGYVAPEYASTGLLNERSDVYSFGVLLMEIITGRDPVDYSRPNGEVNLVDWLKVMVGNRRSEEVVDPRLEVKPSSRALKRALLVALRCVDPDAQKRPKMGHVVHMLDADDYPYRDDRRVRGTSSSTKDSLMNPARRVNNHRDNPSNLHKNRGISEDNFELALESPSGPGYKPSLRRYGA